MNITNKIFNTTTIDQSSKGNRTYNTAITNQRNKGVYNALYGDNNNN